ncbi:recombinase family protein [Nesterenkonia sp. LB17]|uniref:recombinase family protein n=1 Tax=Nesterenkonia sp. LB17 TaxID=2901230 RepID=UPI001F4CD108|nr:recombinase family protein [Nesterenkonia sp. LB17]MCH8565261.1 recombinase family protein [Nesterenkonia sp. LB17]
MPTDHAVAAAIYVRISKDSEKLGLGTARQRKDCEELAREKGWTVVEVFKDDDTSASNGKARPAYQRMARGIEAGQIQDIIVWDVDRLTRTPRELEDFIDWADQHKLQFAKTGGVVDLATPHGRMNARVKGAVARDEADQQPRRQKRKLLRLAEEDKYVGP